MSEQDGRVLGVTPIRQAANPNSAWNLVIMGDGYVASRIAQFQQDVDDLTNFLLAKKPFNEPAIQNKISISRIDIESDEAGADDPKCKDGQGTGRSVRTFLDSTYCWDKKTHRLLFGDWRLAWKTAQSKVKNAHQVLVIVDDNGHGGAGGGVAWTSKSSDWMQVALHELGHTEFGLADEYGYGKHEPFPVGEPKEPNVTLVADPAQVKWHRLVTAPLNAVPTRKNPDTTCRNSDHGPPPANDVVGTFEDARYWHCKVYRPSWDCLMRNVTPNLEFCPVCTEVIRKRFDTQY